MTLNTFEPFSGQHCETTATGTLLNNLGIKLSEPMLFGLGEGLGFIYWDMKMMDYPFIGGRIKPDILTRNIAKNLNLELVVKETSSPQKAWNDVKKLLDSNIIVGLKLDCYHLDYFAHSHHFAAHYVAIYGYDENYAFLVDTKQQGGTVKTTLDSLSLARNEKGPMSSKNLYYTIIQKATPHQFSDALIHAIRNNARDYLAPPISNIGYKGILKASKEVGKWFNRSKDTERDFCTTALMMEKAGTGGSLFRNLYRDFLKEAYTILHIDILNSAFRSFSEIAELWYQISVLFDTAGKTKDPAYIEKASEILKNLSEMEKTTMESLRDL